jgi:hypothetical protein
VSLSSSEPERARVTAERGSIRALLARSLAGIRQAVPEQHRALCTALAGLEVQLRLDHEDFSVRGAGGNIVLSAEAPVTVVELATTSRTVVSLVDGKLDLLDAVLDEAVTLAGSIDNLLRFDDVLLAYLHGIVRCPASGNLMAEFRTLSEQRSSAKM